MRSPSHKNVHTAKLRGIERGEFSTGRNGRRFRAGDAVTLPDDAGVDDNDVEMAEIGIDIVGYRSGSASQQAAASLAARGV